MKLKYKAFLLELDLSSFIAVGKQILLGICFAKLLALKSSKTPEINTPRIEIQIIEQKIQTFSLK